MSQVAVEGVSFVDIEVTTTEHESTGRLYPKELNVVIPEGGIDPEATASEIIRLELYKQAWEGDIHTSFTSPERIDQYASTHNAEDLPRDVVTQQRAAHILDLSTRLSQTVTQHFTQEGTALISQYPQFTDKFACWQSLVVAQEALGINPKDLCAQEALAYALAQYTLQFIHEATRKVDSGWEPGKSSGGRFGVNNLLRIGGLLALVTFLANCTRDAGAGLEPTYQDTAQNPQAVASPTSVKLGTIPTRTSQPGQVPDIPAPASTATSPAPTNPAAASPTHTPSPTNTPTYTPSPTNTPTHTPSPTNTPTHTPSPTSTPTHTPSPTPTKIPMPVAESCTIPGVTLETADIALNLEGVVTLSHYYPVRTTAITDINGGDNTSAITFSRIDREELIYPDNQLTVEGCNIYARVVLTPRVRDDGTVDYIPYFIVMPGQNRSEMLYVAGPDLWSRLPSEHIIYIFGEMAGVWHPEEVIFTKEGNTISFTRSIGNVLGTIDRFGKYSFRQIAENSTTPLIGSVSNLDDIANLLDVGTSVWITYDTKKELGVAYTVVEDSDGNKTLELIPTLPGWEKLPELHEQVVALNGDPNSPQSPNWTNPMTDPTE